MKLYDLKAMTIEGEEKSFKDYEGKVLLIINTASKCGFTYQFEGLQKLYEEYNEKGLEVVGFPCNQFKEQDPGSSNEIKGFCALNYGVEFQMFEKVDVKGENIHPIYEYLTGQKAGLLGSKEIKWNFTKFLVDKNGNVIKRFSPTTKPEKLVGEIEKLLGR